MPGFLERIGLVKSEDDGSSETPRGIYSSSISAISLDEEVLPEFELEGLDTKTIISIVDIYNKDNLGDLSKSIFKVDEIRKVVPAELSTDAKKKTVLGMLTVAGLDVTALLQDASARVAILSSADEAFQQEATHSVTSDEGKITDLEAQIDELKKNIDTTKSTHEAQAKAIKDEIAKIDDITKFIG